MSTTITTKQDLSDSRLDQPKTPSPTPIPTAIKKIESLPPIPSRPSVLGPHYRPIAPPSYMLRTTPLLTTPPVRKTPTITHSISSPSFLPPDILKEKGNEEVLKCTYNKPILRPALRSSYWILLRGGTAKDVCNLSRGTSGGGVANLEALPPSKSAIIAQVGEYGRLPEFTVKPTVAESFSTGGYIMAVRIHDKYVARGSESEGGMVCDPSAPLELLAWAKGRSFIG